MESSSFDRLTRLVADARSRRTLSGALLGSVAGLLGLTEAAAACPKGKKACRKKCIPRARCCTNADCQTKRTGQVCRRGRCQCPAGTKPCQGRCIPTAQCCGISCPQPPPTPDCTTPTDCPAPPSCQLCAERTCVNGRCGVGPAPSGQVCRAARGDCDVAEVCDGSSLDCPADQFQSASVVCLVPVCDGGPGNTFITRPIVYCTGDGPTCPPQPIPEQNCGFYKCRDEFPGVVCRTTCQTDDDCIQSAHCAVPACVPD
jgi:hypothetical protein